MVSLKSPLQIVLFGSPGTGKSHYVKTEILPSLAIEPSGDNCIPTVFHPEYSYGDFMGKLLPLSAGGKVEYQYYAGHFLKALARAYRNILVETETQKQGNVALVIDEINRGNSAAIFGTAFQLLDRDARGWSTYEVDISDMEFAALLRSMGAEIEPIYREGGVLRETRYVFNGKSYTERTIGELLEPLGMRANQIRIPPNLSLIATMNTSDNSIYYMDTAFKRRWDWQYIDNDSSRIGVEGIAFNNRDEWAAFIYGLNQFIRRSNRYVRKVEDKLIGHWFISDEQITKSQIQNKVMFYLWDSVFVTNRQPLAELLDVSSSELVTFGDFAKLVDSIIGKLRTKR